MRTLCPCGGARAAMAQMARRLTPSTHTSAERTTLPPVSVQCGPDDAQYADRLREALQAMRFNVAGTSEGRTFEFPFNHSRTAGLRASGPESVYAATA